MSLRVEDLQVYYRSLRGDVKAVDGVSFDVADGEIMGLAGESGCGKSTLGKSLIRLDGRMRYIHGRVELDGAELPIDDSSEMNTFRFREISIVPQYAMSALNPTRKIGRMIGDLLESRGVDALFLPGVEVIYPAGHTTRVSVAGVSEPLEGELPVAQLRPCVLGGGGHARAQPGGDPGLLRLGQHARRVHVEHRLHARGGDVGVLAARAGGAAGAQFDVRQRQLHPRADHHRVVHRFASRRGRWARRGRARRARSPAGCGAGRRRRCRCPRSHPRRPSRR